MTLTDLYLLSSLVLGLLVGSFLNVVIYRLPLATFSQWRQQAREILIEHGELPTQQAEPSGEPRFNIAFPASHCPVCKAEIKPWHNIPVLSYLLLRGKCHYCGVKIRLRYPIVEAICGVLTAFVMHHFGYGAQAALAMLLTWCLITLTLIDIDHLILPDQIVLPLLWAGLLANSASVFTDLHSAVIGAVAGYLSLWSVYWLFKLLTGKEGMGYGDFKLLAALGAWAGWQMLPLVILLSAVVGAVIGIAGIIVSGRDKNLPIPFGPFLAAAGWIAFLWGDSINANYLQMLGASG